MGVRGLKTFVEKHQRSLYTRKKISSCSLVIDGFGLLFHLYFESGLDSRYGGEYEEFVKRVEHFFSSLKLCDIKPYVIFDGPIPPSKVSCILSRLQDRINDVKRMLSGNDQSCRVLPMLAVSIFQQTLVRLEVPFAFSLNDADAEVVAMANHLECPVLGDDSDYYIFQVEHGYLPLGHFYWDEPNKAGEYSITCRQYTINCMTREFKIGDSALSYLAVLLGNDVFSMDTFASILKNFPQPKSTKNDKRSRHQAKTTDRVRTALSWLAAHWKDEESMKRKLESSLSRAGREEGMKGVENCIAGYRDLPDVAMTVNFLMNSPDVFHPSSSQHALELLVKQGKLPSVAMDVVNLHSVFLPVLTSDPNGPSPHLCSEEIRILLYKIIAACYAPPPVSAFAKIFTVQEYDKVETEYKSRKWIVVDRSSCPICNQDCPGAQCCRVPVTQDKFGHIRNLTLDLLQLGHLTFTLDPVLVENSILCGGDPSIVTCVETAMIATLYWQKATLPGSTIICSILLNMVWSLYRSKTARDICSRKTGGNFPTRGNRGPQHGRNVAPSSHREEELSFAEFLDIFYSYPPSADGKSQKLDVPPDLKLLHAATEWQSVFHGLCQLQTVVLERRVIHVIECCFASGWALHEVYHRLERLCRQKRTTDLESVRNTMLGQLQRFPKLQTTFQMLSNILLQ